MNREQLSTFMAKRIGSLDLNDLYLLLQDVEETLANNSGSKVTDLSLHDFCILLLEAENPLATRRLVLLSDFVNGEYSFDIRPALRIQMEYIFLGKTGLLNFWSTIPSLESLDDYDPFSNKEMCFWVGRNRTYLDLSLVSKSHLIKLRATEEIVDTIEKMVKERGYEMLP